MKSGPTKVNGKAPTDFTETRFTLNPQSAPGISPKLSTAIHSSSGGEESREQSRALVLPPQLSPVLPPQLSPVLLRQMC